MSIHDITTSDGSRAYIRDFFVNCLCRYDFGNYITEDLAADFACVLAEYLSQQDGAPGQSGEPLTHLRKDTFGNFETVDPHIDGAFPVYAALQPSQPMEAGEPTGDQVRAIIKSVGSFGTNYADAPMEYVLAGWRAAKIAPSAVEAGDDVRERIARALHYPSCWDTAAYPTLESAACEAIACAKLRCSICEAAPSAVVPDDERAAFELALRETYAMVDPLNPPPAGSYYRGQHEGIIAALQTMRDNFARAASPQATATQPAQAAQSEPEPGTTEYGSWINKAKQEADQRFAFHRESFKYLCAFQQELRALLAAQPATGGKA